MDRIDKLERQIFLKIYLKGFVAKHLHSSDSAAGFQPQLACPNDSNPLFGAALRLSVLNYYIF
jgi:hypothetical protein